MTEQSVGGAQGFVRERGTWRIVAGIVGVLVAYYGYNAIHALLMQQVKWPPLKPDRAGLTVLGLRDEERRGWQPPYQAIESGRQWRIRRTEEGEAQADAEDLARGAAPKRDEERPENAEEQADRSAMPAGAGRVSRGEVVPLDELMAKLPTVLTGRHFGRASYRDKTDPFMNRRFFLVDLSLTDEGRSRFFQYSQEHDKERLVFVLNGLILFCPRIEKMDVSTLTIDPVWDEIDAKKITEYLNAQKR
jgi:hypothetical protein